MALGRLLALPTLALCLLALTSYQPAVASPITFTVSSSSNDVHFACLPQYYPTKTLDSWNKAGQAVVYVRNVDADKCQDVTELDRRGVEVVHRKMVETKLNDDDLAAVAGKVALVQGAACDFSLWRDWSADWRNRVLQLKDAGAVGVLFAEYHAKPLTFVVTENQELPTCALSSAEFARLMTHVGIDLAGPGQMEADLSKVYLYREEDDLPPDPDITTLSVSEPWKAGGPDGLPFALPARAATFNPETSPEVEAEVVEVTMSETCWAEEFKGCIECWNRPGGPVINSLSLTGKVAFFRSVLETGSERYGNPDCYSYYFHWSELAESRGAVGVLFGPGSPYNWPVPGLYLTPGSVTIPFFVLQHFHSDLIVHMLEEAAGEQSHTVQVDLPALSGGVAPAYYSPSDEGLEPTAVGFWVNKTDHFLCDAGQATFNPSTHPGFAPASWANGEAGSEGADLLLAKPSEACSDTSECGPCLASPLHISTVGGADVTSVPANSAVFMMDVIDFPCYHSYVQFVTAAEAAGAAGVLLVNVGLYDSFTYAASPGDLEKVAPTIPVFNIPFVCGVRLLRHDDGHPIHVAFPELVNGAAVPGELEMAHYGTRAEGDQAMEPTFLKVVEGPADLCPEGSCMVGQSRFGPYEAPSIKAEVVVAWAVAVCREVTTCVECDQMSKVFYGEDGLLFKPGELEGKIALVDERHLTCLEPLHNALWAFQRPEGPNPAAVVVITAHNETVTFAEGSVPFEATTRMYNVPFVLGNAMAGAALDGNELVLQLPRRDRGAARGDGVGGADYGSSSGSGESYTAKRSKDDDFPVLGVSLGCVCIALLGFGGGYWWVRHKQRRSHAFSQFDQGVQADFVDLQDIAIQGMGDNVGAEAAPPRGHVRILAPLPAAARGERAEAATEMAAQAPAGAQPDAPPRLADP